MQLVLTKLSPDAQPGSTPLRLTLPLESASTFQLEWSLICAALIPDAHRLMLRITWEAHWSLPAWPVSLRGVIYKGAFTWDDLMPWKDGKQSDPLVGALKHTLHGWKVLQSGVIGVLPQEWEWNHSIGPHKQLISIMMTHDNFLGLD